MGKVYSVMEETATKNALMDQAFTYTLLLTHRSQELQVFVSVRLLSCLSLFILSIFNPLHVTNLFFFSPALPVAAPRRTHVQH